MDENQLSAIDTSPRHIIYDFCSVLFPNMNLLQSDWTLKIFVFSFVEYELYELLNPDAG